MSRSLNRFLLSLVTLALTACGFAASAADPSVSVTAEELRAFDMINALRVADGKAPLVLQPQIVSAAQGFSDTMARLGPTVMLHNGLTGPEDTVFNRIKATGVTWFSAWAENLSPALTADDAVGGWSRSTGHNLNMRNENYKYAGIAVRTGSDGRRYWTLKLVAADLEGTRGDVLLPSGVRLGANGEAGGNSQNAGQQIGGNQQIGGQSNQTATEISTGTATFNISSSSLNITNRTDITLQVWRFEGNTATVVGRIGPNSIGSVTMPTGSDYLVNVFEDGQKVKSGKLTESENITLRD